MLNDSYSWLIWSTDSEVLNKLTKLNLGLTSDVVLAIGDPAHSQAILYDMHKVNYSSTLETEIAAKWSTAQRLNLLLNKTKIRMRRDFKGLKLRGTVVVSITLTYLYFKAHTAYLNMCSNFGIGANNAAQHTVITQIFQEPKLKI